VRFSPDPTPLPTDFIMSVALASAEAAACQLPNVENSPSIGFIFYQALLE